MIRPPFVALIVAAALLALPSAAAVNETQNVARFEARDLTGSGAGVASGDLAGLVISVLPGGPSDPAAGTFTIHADQLTVEADLHRYDNEFIATTTEGNISNDARPYGRAEVRSETPWDGYTLSILPRNVATRPTFHGPWTHINVSPSPLETLAVTNWATQDPARRIQAPTAGSLDVTHKGMPGTFSLSGDFRVSLWFWNVTITTPEHPGGTLEWSGDVSDGVAGVETPDGLRSNVRRQQLVLDVQGGFLEFTKAPATIDAFLVQDARFAGDANWVLREANGLLGDGKALRPASAQELTLEGDLVFDADARDDGRLDAEIQGDLTSARLDGVRAPWAATVTVEGSTWRPGAWTVAIVGLALAPAAGLAGRRVHRHLEERRMEALEALMSVSDYEGVVRESPRLAKSRSFAHDAFNLRVEALLRLGRTKEAQELVDAEPDWEGPARASQDLVRGVVAAHAGDRARAVAHLERALRAAPEYRGEVLGRPALAGVRNDPRLRTLLQARPDTGRPSIAYA